MDEQKKEYVITCLKKIARVVISLGYAAKLFPDSRYRKESFVSVYTINNNTCQQIMNISLSHGNMLRFFSGNGYAHKNEDNTSILPENDIEIEKLKTDILKYIEGLYRDPYPMDPYSNPYLYVPLNHVFKE